MLAIPPGFFWHTVESEDATYDTGLSDEDVNYDTQNTMSLIYKKVYRDPYAMMGILNRTLQEGLDLCGIRLLYPTPELMKVQYQGVTLFCHILKALSTEYAEFIVRE